MDFFFFFTFILPLSSVIQSMKKIIVREFNHNLKGEQDV